ncbi:MAG: T9SS type A sorting domain-containing protein [Bacteroidetes bacterium]|nr:T9SS type A sorting domain-containing protein [Bacteroidota bacterium]
MKKYLFFLFVLLFLHLKSSGQNWPQIYGDDLKAQVRSMVEDYDHGYLIAGQIDRTVPSQWGWLIKTDINGNILWDKKFGSLGYQTYFNQIQKNEENETFIVGSTSKYESSYDDDPLIMKLDACGEIIWCTVLRSEGNNCLMKIIQLGNNHIIGLLKYFGGDIANIRISLVEFDENGNPLWIKHMAQEDTTIFNEEGWFLNLTSDSTYLISGRCFSNGMQAFYINADKKGDQIWDIKWQGGALSSSRQTVEFKKGIFYSAGAYADNGPITPSIFKYSINGGMIYQKYILGDTIRGGDTWPLCMYNDTSLVIGLEWSEFGTGVDDGNSEVFLIDTLGNIIKRRFLIAEGQPPENTIKTFDDKILVIGNYYTSPNWDIYLWKLNQQLENDSVYNQIITYDSLCPYTIISDTTDLNCNLYVDIIDIPLKEDYDKVMKLFPNPVGNQLNVEFAENLITENSTWIAYDIFGRKQMEMRLDKDQRTLEVNTSLLKSGIYISVLLDRGYVISKEKFIVNLQ